MRFVGLLLALSFPATASAQVARARIDAIEQLFGASPTVAVTGNGRLTAGLSEGGVLCVLRWPSTTYWDHVRYRTSQDPDARDLPRLGAAETDGGFWGVFVPGQGTSWLRDDAWVRSTSYAGPTSPVVVTTYDNEALGITARGEDVVQLNADRLDRRLSVQGLPAGGKVFHYLGLAPHADHKPFRPDAEYTDDRRRQGTVSWSGSSGLWEPSEGAEHVSIRLLAAPDEVRAGVDGTAYEDAADGSLQEATTASGRVDLALAWRTGEASLSLEFASSGPVAEPVDPDDHWAQRLAGARWPKTEDTQELWFAQRTVVSLLMGVDFDTAAIVASASQQPPYHLDWPRDGAFFNVLLDLVGENEIVTRHNALYAALQRTEDGQDRFGVNVAPAGSWAMNYYADGTPGGPIDFEIDQVGFVLWTMVAHARFSLSQGHAGAMDHLRSLWPAIRRAADLVAGCRDTEIPALQCAANEDDDPVPSRTLHGAQTVLLGLRSAAEGATILGEDGSAWRARAAALQAAIEEHFWDPDAGHFSADGIGQNAWAMWPVRLWPRDDPRWDGVADRLLSHLQERLVDAASEGSAYDSKATVALAWLLHDTSDPRRQPLGEAIRILATEVPMKGTRHLGEVYLPLPDADGDGRPDGWSNRTSPPHLWEATLVNLSLLEFYEPGTLDAYDDPPAPNTAPSEPGCGCVVGSAARGASWRGLTLALVAWVRCSRRKRRRRKTESRSRPRRKAIGPLEPT